MKYLLILISAIIICRAGYLIVVQINNKVPVQDTVAIKTTVDTLTRKQPVEIVGPVIIANNLSQRDSIVAFAKTLIGTPYLYASTDPTKGFDCSGFINYVYNHFNIIVPRSSYDFMNVGRKIAPDSCQLGDLLLFTGTAPEEKNIGHIGIVCDAKTKWPSFIHSSSGKANGVTITSMESEYYQNRFVAVVDILSK